MMADGVGASPNPHIVNKISMLSARKFGVLDKSLDKFGEPRDCSNLTRASKIAYYVTASPLGLFIQMGGVTETVGTVLSNLATYLPYILSAVTTALFVGAKKTGGIMNKLLGQMTPNSALGALTISLIANAMFTFAPPL